jgi:GNAT superfamily N-acetyltransferase
VVSVRTATAHDKIAVARVHVRSWQVGYSGLLPGDVLAKLKPKDRAARYTFGDDDPSNPLTIVATEGKAIVGFATLGPSRDPDGSDAGQIFALYVDPDLWGHGVGRTLMSRARDILREMSFVVATLWVLEGNRRAIRFYEIDGWSRDGSCREDVVWGVRVNEIRMRRPLI